MKVAGSSNIPEVRPQTTLQRFNDFRDRYRRETSVALAVLASLTYIVATAVPCVQEFVTRTGLIEFITLVVLLDVSVSVRLLQRPPRARVAENQDESMPGLIQALPHCRTEGAELLEYAGATVLPLVRAIQREGVSLRMLVKHPETVDGIQRHRNIATLDTIYNSIFKDSPAGSLEIRCYKLPYALRGRCLGKELLEVGWLTPDVKGQTAFGHGGPSLIADLSGTENMHLYSFFRETFDNYWNDPGTEDGRKVLERMCDSS